MFLSQKLGPHINNFVAETMSEKETQHSTKHEHDGDFEQGTVWNFSNLY